MTAKQAKVVAVQRKRIELKFNKKKPLLDLAECLLTMMQMANSNYWLHPEYDNPNDYIVCELSIKYPQFDWFYCSKQKQIKMKV
jgi:hypothetical protein